MSNPFFNPQRVLGGVMNSAFDEAKKMLLTAVQNKNPAVFQRIMQLYQNPYDALLKSYPGNAQAQKEIDALLKDKPVEEQRLYLVNELEKSGINVRAMAAQFGIKL